MLHSMYDKLRRGEMPSSGGILNNAGAYKFAWGAGAPSNAAAGYAVGCLYQRTDGGAGTAAYVNEGTALSTTWTAIASGTFTLQQAFATGSEITGAAAGTPMIVGDGTDSVQFYATNASNRAFITTGGSANLTIAPAGGATTVTGTATVSGDLTVGSSKLVVTAATGALALAAGASIALDTNKFTVDASGNVACAGTLQATGDITGTFAGTLATSAWAANPTITVSATTGNGVTIAGQSVTSGTLLYLACDASLTGGSGNFMRCYNDATAATVFTLASNGAVTIAGTAAADALTLNAGDLTVSAGGIDIIGGAVATDLLDITRSNSATGGNAIDINMGSAAIAGNAIDIEWAGAATGDAVSINMTNNVAGSAMVVTGAGVRTDHLFKITDVPKVTACTLYLGVTPTAAEAAAYPVQIQTAGTGIAPCIYVAHTNAYATAANGVIHLAMANAVASTGLVIAGAGTRVRPLISLIDTGDNGGGAIKIAQTQTNAAAYGIQITETGTVANNLIELAYAGASTGDAININMTNAAAGAQALVVSSGVAATSPTVSLTTANGAAATLYMSNGSTNAAGHGISILQHGAGGNNALYVAYDAASTGDAISVLMNGANAASQALVLSSNVAHTGNVVDVISTGFVGADGKGIVAITSSTSTFVHANAACLLITNSATGAANGLGTSLRIIDTGATASCYAVYISAATCEALNVAAGTSTFAETINVADIAGNDASLAITGLAAATGGAIVITGGTSAGAGTAGGLVSVTGGVGGAGGAGGAASLVGGAPASGTANGGAVSMTSGAAGAAGGTAGAVTIDSGGAGGGAANAVTIGGTNATAVNLGHNGINVVSTSRITTTDGVASGTARVVGGRAYSKVSDTTSSSTASEEALGSYTIPANTLGANSVLRVRFGVFVTNSNGADTLIIRLRLGPTTLTGTAIFTSATTDAVNSNILYGEFTLIVREAASADSSISAYGIATYTQAASGTAAPVCFRMAPTDFATNGALLLEVTSQWSDAQATNDATCEFMEVEIA